MKINSVKCKQIKKGVYDLRHGGEIVAADVRYTLPQNCTVVPKKNIILITTYNSAYAWQFITHRNEWRVWRISSKERLDEAIQTVYSAAFDMVIERHEGNKALMMIPANKCGKPMHKHEWRYFTSFFLDLVRKDNST